MVRDLNPEMTKKYESNLHASLQPVNHVDVARKMRLDYSYSKGDRSLRVMDSVQNLFNHLQNLPVDVKALMTDAANIINRQFSIREVAIGLRSPVDGKYRYEVLVGYRTESEEAHRRLAYTHEEMYDATTYKATILSKYTKLFLAEDEPYAAGEETTYNRPMMLKLRRKGLDDSIEGDYLDTNIYGANDALLGWIEISGTNAWKLPDIAIIKWIEIIACIIGGALTPRFTTATAAPASEKT